MQKYHCVGCVIGRVLNLLYSNYSVTQVLKIRIVPNRVLAMPVSAAAYCFLFLFCEKYQYLFRTFLTP